MKEKRFTSKSKNGIIAGLLGYIRPVHIHYYRPLPSLYLRFGYWTVRFVFHTPKYNGPWWKPRVQFLGHKVIYTLRNDNQ